MASQQPRRQSRGDQPRPPQLRPDSWKTQAGSQPVVPSVEAPDLTGTKPTRPSIQPPPSPSQNSVFRVPESSRSANNDLGNAAAKVAIPRLKRSLDTIGEASTRSGGRHRVNHACEPCRHRKTKCSGERPVCRHCQDFKITCYYADGKRDRVKKQFGSMTEKVADYERLLKDLLGRVNEEDAKMIRSSLEKETSYEVDDMALDAATAPSIDAETLDDESGAESDVSAGAGSTGALDRTEEDFTREEARNTGFIGKNSEITWLQRLKRESKVDDEVNPPGQPQGSPAQVPPPEADRNLSVQDTNYHLDDLAITTFEAVDPYEMPTPETAHILFNSYISRVHPSFPIVGRANLTSQFQRFISGHVQRPPEKWLAIVNLIFAISAKYSHLIQADWKGDERDHLIYFTRARLLSMNGETIFQHPDLQIIQVLGLMSFYFLCTSQVNRAWTMAGIAIRDATALGMNMRNDSAGLKDSLKEMRYRVWWALYTLEHRLCSMTGRVNCILDEHCTTPLPVPLEEDQFDTVEAVDLLSKERQQGDRAPQSNVQTPTGAASTPSTDRSRSQTKVDKSRSPSTPQANGELEWAKGVLPNPSLFFLHYVQLNRLTQNAFHRLYNPRSIEGTWSDVQAKIKDLDAQLENWYRKLPAIFDFRRKQRDRSYYEFRLNLGFFYYATKMMVHRPCLCRLDRKIPGQSNKSQDFNHSSATTCVESAQDMLRLIPDEPNAVGLNRVGPWWSILHWLVQAAAVLMLEISFRAHHMPEDADSIVEASKKVVRWLHSLGEDNMAAQRAWSQTNTMLRHAVVKIGRDVSDLPDRPPRSNENSSRGGSTVSAYQDPNNANSGPTHPIDLSNTLYSAPPAMADFPAYPSLDAMMQYDQYLPTNQALVQSMNFQQNDPEMEFMSNAYHED